MTIDKLPQPLDSSTVSNTAAAIAGWCLKALVPRLNEVIENQQAIIKELRDEDPVRDGTPGSGSFSGPAEAGGDGANVSAEAVFATNGEAAQEATAALDGPTSEDIQALAALLQNLDSRAAENLGAANLSAPDALREATDEELLDVAHVGEVALEKIREVFPYADEE